MNMNKKERAALIISSMLQINGMTLDDFLNNIETKEKTEIKKEKEKKSQS